MMSPKPIHGNYGFCFQFCRPQSLDFQSLALSNDLASVGIIFPSDLSKKGTTVDRFFALDCHESSAVAASHNSSPCVGCFHRKLQNSRTSNPRISNFQITQLSTVYMRTLLHPEESAYNEDLDSLIMLLPRLAM